MTREEAKAILKGFMENPLFSDIPKVCRAFDMAIKALEQQSCNTPRRDLATTSQDCISREAVLDLINANWKYEGLETDVASLPSVAPKSLELKDVLDSIKAEILDEAEYAYADFDQYKEDILHAEPDELPDDDFRYGLERAVEIINKYMAESEDKE